MADYAAWFAGLGKAGGNWARLWLAFNEKGLEWMPAPTPKGGTGSYQGLGRYALDNAWRLDDGDPSLPQVGNAFVEQAVKLGVPIITAHKGLSTTLGYTSPHASPADFGPAAKAHPNVSFVAYHSGFEPNVTEGPYDDAHANVGVNRLITSMRSSGMEVSSASLRIPYALSMPFRVTSTEVDPPDRTSSSGSRAAAAARNDSFFAPVGSQAFFSSTGASWPSAEKVSCDPRSSRMGPQVLASHNPSCFAQSSRTASPLAPMATLARPRRHGRPKVSEIIAAT